MSPTLHAIDDGAAWIAGIAVRPVPLAVSIRLRTLDGAVVRWEAREGDGLTLRGGELQLSFTPRREGEALVIEWRLRSLARSTQRLDTVTFEAAAAGWPLLEDPARLTLLQNGYQSWTPTAPVRGDARPAFPLLRSFALMNHYVDSPLWGRRDGLLSSLFALLRADGEAAAVLMGFLTQHVGLGEWFLRNRGARGLLASLDYGGRHLAPGEVLEGEPLWIEVGPADALLARYADAFGRAMGARIGASSPVGWCSWYHYYTRVTARDVLDNAAALQRLPELGVGFVQLDDGYQDTVGDWLDHNEKFPEGLASLAAGVRALGFGAGLWTAPFFAVPGSRLLREHPDWRLLSEAGRPIATGFNPVWRARTFALDLTHPEVSAWLGEVFQALAAQGFELFKIDFLFAGLRHGARREPGRSPVEAYRAGLRAIRQAVGEDVFLLGCGAPLGPSVGLVDGMRVSQDVKEQWDSRLAAFVGRGAGYPAARGALRNDVSRSFTHRRWWLNDPDCLLVRDLRTKLTEVEVRTLVTVLGATGGMLLLSDDMGCVSEARLDLVRAVLPPTVLAGGPLDPLAPDDLCVAGEGGALLLVLVNLGSRSERRAIPCQPGPGVWIDLWRAEVVTTSEVEVAPHGVRALRFTPHGDHPQLLADGLHLTAGLDGRVASRFEPGTGRLLLTVGDVARSGGWLALRVPAAWSLDAEGLPDGVTVRAREDGIVWLTVETPPPWERALAFRVHEPPRSR